jgi:methionyl-tRNA synthetase
MKKDVIEFADFEKLDLRVGEVTEAIAVEKSKKLIKLTVDLGEDYGTATVFTGMLEFHTPETFIGKKFAFIANLAPRKMVGGESQGMILAADAEGTPILIPADSRITNGTVVR